MFLGTFNHNLDSKNRLTIPSKIVEKLTDYVVVSKGFDGCLELRTKEKFDEYTNKLLSLSQNKANSRALLRQLLANANEIEIDSAKRILIPTNLLKEANIDKNVTIIGLGDKLEIWDSLKYEEFKNKTDNILEELAENLPDDETI